MNTFLIEYYEGEIEALQNLNDADAKIIEADKQKVNMGLEDHMKITVRNAFLRGAISGRKTAIIMFMNAIQRELKNA